MIPSQEKEDPKKARQAPTRHGRLDVGWKIVGSVHLVCVSSTGLKCPLQELVFSTLLL